LESQLSKLNEPKESDKKTPKINLEWVINSLISCNYN
jgi:hypothetical protein